MARETLVIGNVPLFMLSITRPYPYLVSENVLFQLTLSAWWGTGDYGWAEQLYSWVIKEGKDVLPRVAHVLPGRNPVDYDTMLYEIFDNVCNHEDILTEYFVEQFSDYDHLLIGDISFNRREFRLSLMERL